MRKTIQHLVTEEVTDKRNEILGSRERKFASKTR